jgi:hypothetical protein
VDFAAGNAVPLELLAQNNATKTDVLRYSPAERLFSRFFFFCFPRERFSTFAVDVDRFEIFTTPRVREARYS